MDSMCPLNMCTSILEYKIKRIQNTSVKLNVLNKNLLIVITNENKQ